MRWSMARGDFLAGSAAVLGGAAVGGVFLETALAANSTSIKVAVNNAYVRVSGKNYFLPVQAWVSQRVVSMTNATSPDKLQALVERIIYDHEQIVSIVTHNGLNLGKIRLYVDVPHQVGPGSHLHNEMGVAQPGLKCVGNTMCIDWLKEPDRECCSSFSCCNLA